MTRTPYTVSAGSLDGLPTLEINGPAVYASIAQRGATLLEWNVRVGDVWIPLVDGYRTGDELRAQNGVRMGVMAPFVNRIADARYTFGGVEHDLRPGDPDRLVYHGITREMDFSVASVRLGGSDATIAFSLAGTQLAAAPGYPFDVDVDVVYRFHKNGLDLSIQGTNSGEQPAPFAAGWHPYFRLRQPMIDELEIDVPTDRFVRTDKRLIPVAEDRVKSVTEDTDLRGRLAIGDRALDICYVDLETDTEGIARTSLIDRRNELALTVWQKGGAMHVFTGHTLKRDPRASIALEPVETITNAFNDPDLHGSLTLAPGASRSFSCGVTYLAAQPAEDLTELAGVAS